MSFWDILKESSNLPLLCAPAILWSQRLAVEAVEAMEAGGEADVEDMGIFNTEAKKRKNRHDWRHADTHLMRPNTNVTETTLIANMNNMI